MIVKLIFVNMMWICQNWACTVRYYLVALVRHCHNSGTLENVYKDDIIHDFCLSWLLSLWNQLCQNQASTAPMLIASDWYQSRSGISMWTRVTLSLTLVPSGCNPYQIDMIFSYTLSRECRMVRNRYSRLLFTSEDRLCANLHVEEQSTNMTSQCQ